MTTPETCGHDACRCTRPYSKQTQAASTERIDPDGEFCSKLCADSARHGEHGDGGCRCGHPQCQAPADEAIPPMQ